MMHGSKSYGRAAPKPKPEKLESWSDYEERMVHEDRVRVELVKSIRRAHGTVGEHK